MAKYGWIITKDHIAESGATPGTNANAVGVIGPRDISPEHQAALQRGTGRAFRMYDDDGELYYSGRIVGENAIELGQDAFGPLDDYGRPNAGCTEIRYMEGGKWQSL